MNRIFVIGLMLFFLFFGAGNLIFPIKLGFESGSYFWLAMAGFLLTGVGLPLLGVIASAVAEGGIANRLAQKVHPLFSLVFMVAIYLTIGPLFAIPRTATVAYEIGVSPFVTSSSLNLLIFTVIYFGLVLVFSLKPSTMVDIIGKILAPVFLMVIALLCILAAISFDHNLVQPTSFTKLAFGTGFLEGYLTMDAIASLAFALIAVSAINALGFTDRKSLIKNCIIASLITGLCFCLVYIALGWVGNHYPITENDLAIIQQTNAHLGAYLLQQTSHTVFGWLSPIMVGSIVFLACITTAIGLVCAVAGYFAEKFPRLKYQHYVYFFTLLSFILANQGLNQVITLSAPVLMVLYPLTIVSIFLVLLDAFISLPRLAYQLCLAVTLLISCLMEFLPKFISFLPLNEASLAWLIPAIISVAIAYCIGKNLKMS